jgi:hypothetical protein
MFCYLLRSPHLHLQSHPLFRHLIPGWYHLLRHSRWRDSYGALSLVQVEFLSVLSTIKSSHLERSTPLTKIHTKRDERNYTKPCEVYQTIVPHIACALPLLKPLTQYRTLP